jgi:ketosteroid isomerase-like protein
VLKLRSLSLTLALSVVAALVIAAGCSSKPETPPDNSAAAVAAVQKADADWSAAAQALNADSWVAFYGDDAVVLAPNAPMAMTKDDIHKSIANLLALPGLSVSWQTTKAEASRSGDLAYTYGTYVLTANDASGKPSTDHGKYSEVWKKQADGTWKCVVDIWNSDLPMAAAAAPATKHHAGKHARKRRHHAR